MAYIKFYVGLDLDGNPIKNFALESLPQDPESNLHSGRVWLNTTTNEFKIFDGEEIITISGADASVTQLLSAAKAGQLIISAGDDGSVKIYDSAGLVKINASGEVAAAIAGEDYESSDSESELSNKSINLSANSLTGVDNRHFADGVIASDLSSADNTQLAGAAAVKSYASSTLVSLANFKGELDASEGVLPEASTKGDYWRVSVQGEIEGLGMLEAGDVVVAAISDAEIASDFFVLQGNLTDAVVAESTDENYEKLAAFTDAAGKIISGATVYITGKKDINIPDESAAFKIAGESIIADAVKTYKLSFEETDWQGESAPYSLSISDHGLDASLGIAISVRSAIGDKIDLGNSIANGDIILTSSSKFEGVALLTGLAATGGGGAFGPGPQVLTHGDMDEGYFGLLNSEDADYIEPWKLLDAVWDVGASDKASLESQWGSKGNGNLTFSGGTAYPTATDNLDVPWMKFALDGKILLIPLRSLVNSISWDQINAKNAVFGKDISIDGVSYKCRLMTGGTSQNDATSEWNRLMYKIAATSAKGTEDWDSFTADDLGLSGQGYRSWCQDIVSGTDRVSRGLIGDVSDFHVIYSPGSTHNVCGFRPVLELIP